MASKEILDLLAACLRVHTVVLNAIWHLRGLQVLWQVAVAEKLEVLNAIWHLRGLQFLKPTLNGFFSRVLNAIWHLRGLQGGIQIA
jgi:hypothetical protein